MTRQPGHALRPDHAGHDLESVAAYAGGDSVGADRARAEAQVRDCEDCARLFADLRAIATATRTLPPPFEIARDFRLSPADAARLAGGRWRRVFGGLGRGAPAARPFAAVFTTLGIVGLLIATAPFMSLMGSGGAYVGNAAASQAAAGPVDASKSATGTMAGELAAQSHGASAGSPRTSGFPVAAGSPAGSPATRPGSSFAAPIATGGGADSGGARDSQNPAYFISPVPTQDHALGPMPAVDIPAAPSSPLVPLSLAFIAVGVGFFALGRRSARGP